MGRAKEIETVLNKDEVAAIVKEKHVAKYQAQFLAALKEVASRNEEHKLDWKTVDMVLNALSMVLHELDDEVHELEMQPQGRMLLGGLVSRFVIQLGEDDTEWGERFRKSLQEMSINVSKEDEDFYAPYSCPEEQVEQERAEASLGTDVKVLRVCHDGEWYLVKFTCCGLGSTINAEVIGSKGTRPMGSRKTELEHELVDRVWRKANGLLQFSHTNPWVYAFPAKDTDRWMMWR